MALLQAMPLTVMTIEDLLLMVHMVKNMDSLVVIGPGKHRDSALPLLANTAGNERYVT